ncbi:hypothetical protein QBC43DRAFT_372023 [Cladorrhinum sp. PSN259]|nr:hypothetical protein QBC43DRAFT_372023 [Cladorrhinum sp. PSN259]
MNSLSMATLLLITLLPSSLAQTYNEMTPSTYFHPKTNLTFTTWTAPPGTSSTEKPFMFGTVPSLSTPSSYTGILKCKTPGWCGLSHGPSMLQQLLLVTWVELVTKTVKTQFRIADDYFEPYLYTGSLEPVLEQLEATVNEDGNEFEIVYRCKGCAAESGIKELGYAVSLDRPFTVEDEGKSRVKVEFHDEAYGIWDISG